MTVRTWAAGEYLTDERRLFWVLHRRGPDLVVIEDCKSGDRLEVADADLQAHRLVRANEPADQEDGSRRPAHSVGSGDGRARSGGEDS